MLRSSSAPRARLATRLAVLAMFLIAAAAAADDAARDAGVFEFGSLNRSHDRLAADIAPIESGAVVVRLSSPRHLLTLISNRVVLRPLASGVYDLALQLEFSGSGQLIADLDVSGMRSKLEDELVVPVQKRTVVAKVQIARSASGYLLTPVELPTRFEVSIESRLGAQLVSVCKGLSAFGLLPLSCAELERSLSLVAVPMPAPGETYLLETDRLSAAERSAVDAFLTRTGAKFLSASEPR